MSLWRSLQALLATIFYPLSYTYKPLSDGSQYTSMVTDVSLATARPRPRSQTEANANRKSWFRQSIHGCADIVERMIPSKRSAVGNGDLGSQGKRQKASTSTGRHNTRDTNRNLPVVEENGANQPIAKPSANSKTRPSGTVTHSDHSERQFRDRLDGGSEKELIKEFETLKHQVESSVLTIIDDWEKTRNGSGSRMFEFKGWSLSKKWDTHLQDVLSTRFCGQLQVARKHLSFEDYTNVVANALTAVASYKVFEIVSKTFTPTLHDSSAKDFDYVFQRLLSTEPQATALRWRAYVYKAILDRRASDVDNFQKQQQSDLLDAFREVLDLAGVRQRYCTGLEGTLAQSGIIEGAMKLSENLKTKYFSVHMDVYLPKPLEDFDDETMEAIDTETVKVKRPSVYAPGTSLVGCTLFPGLMIHPTNGNETRTQTKKRILVKSQVMRLDVN